jgi:hypothetical protein
MYRYHGDVSHLHQDLVGEQFLQPALGLLRDYTRGVRSDGPLDDETFLRLGLRRALDGDESGRAFLQARGDAGETLARTTWFDAWHSPRRLGLIEQIAARSYAVMERRLAERDWLGAFPELQQRAVWAVDGHQIAHACHAMRDRKGDHVPVGVSYGLCLHTGLLRPLGCFQAAGRRGHEWPLFKQKWGHWLRLEQRPQLPIIVADPAYIDVLFWAQQKMQRQAVVITREKENMKPTVIAAHAFAADDPVNQGVVADQLAGYAYAYLRRIHYRDPATGEEFIFLTTDTVLRPGLIALLYLLRWKIEKAYDVFKNKFRVQKAWSNGANAALLQGHFMALLHNLLSVLLAALERAGVREEKVLGRQVARRRALPAGRRVPAQEMVRHALVLTCQFIRLVRHCLREKTPWKAALPLFECRLKVYL